MAKKAKAVVAVPAGTQTVVIAPPNIAVGEFRIRGTAPLCTHAFPEKVRKIIEETQAAGGTARSKRNRGPKDFDALYQGARYISADGWDGFPAGAVRTAMIDACRLVDFKMTMAKLSIFVVADGFAAESRTPLVRITKGKPQKVIGPMRNSNGGMDLRARPVWDPGWEALVRIRYDADQFSLASVANLLARAGEQVGIGEGRPNSRMSTGCGWGTFEIVN